MSGSTVPEASDDAKRIGIRPPEGSFNPEEISHWSITMTIAWIAWRDFNIVREEWDDYRLACADWMFTGENWLLIPHRPSFWFFLEVRESANKPRISLKIAKWELWKAAGEEDVVATALQCPTRFTYDGSEVIIHGASWPRLSFQVAQSGHATLERSDGVWFRDVRFPRSDVIRIWPKLESARVVARISPPATPVAETEALVSRISRADAARVFKEYREAYQVISTEKQDIEFMRRYGISRDWVRSERKKYPKLPRGRVKKLAD